MWRDQIGIVRGMYENLLSKPNGASIPKSLAYANTNHRGGSGLLDSFPVLLNLYYEVLGLD